MPHNEAYIFPHKCAAKDCDRVVQYDDEPWCFKHSPDEGSSLSGYSARRAAEEIGHDASSVVLKNIFDED